MRQFIKPGKREFDLGTAYAMAEFSKLIYEDHLSVFMALEADGFEGIKKFYDYNDTQAMAVVDDELKSVFLVFRGTESLRDLFRDADIKLFKTDYGAMHRGFYRSFLDVKKEIFDILNPYRSYNLHIAGHSLGGGIAAITSLAFSERRPIVYTFGSPRVFSHPTALRYDYIKDIVHYRIVNNNDAVTKVPGWFRFRHVGVEKYITECGTIMESPSMQVRFKEMFAGMMGDFMKPGLDTISDHFVNAYIRYLWAALTDEIQGGGRWIEGKT